MSEIVSTLLLIAVVVSLGVLVFTFGSSSLSSLTGGFTGLMTGQRNAVAEQFVVEQVSFTPAGEGYVSITLHNAEASATPTSFQQEITWDPATYSTYEAGNLGNVRFCLDDLCATPLYSWLESCGTSSTPSYTSCTSSSAYAIAWVNLGSSTVPATGTLTIYMVFEASTTNFDGVYWGESPQLSSTYAQYDNGANVFAAYFDGNTPTADFTVFTGLTLAQVTGVTGPAGGTINAIAITNEPPAHDPFFAFNTPLSNTAMILESSYTLAADTPDGTGVSGLVNSATATSITNGIAYGEGFGGDYFFQASDTASAVTEPTNGVGAAPAAGTWLYGSLTYTGSAEASFYAQITPALYGTPGQTAGTGYSSTDTLANPLSAATNLYLGSIGGGAAVDIEYNFMRARYYPPSDVMPTTTFAGSVTSSSGANVYVRNVGTISSTLVSVFVVDQTTGTLVGQFPISITLNVGTFVDIPSTTLSFSPSHGQTYSFTVTSALGNGMKLNAEAT